MRRVDWLASLLGVVTIACGSAPAPDEFDHYIRVVALGDSTTEPDWEGSPEYVYTDHLQHQLSLHEVRADVVNAGISNTTSAQGVSRLEADVLRFEPDYVIVQFGINDSWIDANEGRTTPRLTIDEYASSLEAIIHASRAAGAKILLMTANPMRWSLMYGEELRDPALGFDFDDPRGINRLLDLYSERAREVARDEGVLFIDVAARFEAYDRAQNLSIHDLLIDGDEMHPNDAGHALIAQWIIEVLIDDVKSSSARD